MCTKQFTARAQHDTRLLFLPNHTEQLQEVGLDGRYGDLLGDGVLENVIIAPKDVLILQSLGSA